MKVRDLVPCAFGRGRDLLPRMAGCFQDGGHQRVSIAWRNERRLWLKTSSLKLRGTTYRPCATAPAWSRP
jgi:hypothetical protein